MGRHSVPGPDDEPEDSVPSEPEGAADHEIAEPPYDPYLPPYEDSAGKDLEPPASVAPDGEHTGAHYFDDAWQGGHRSTETKRRGVSIGVIVALLTVVLVLAGVIGWRFFGSALSNRSDVAAAACSGTEVPVGVVADPAIAGQIAEFADRFNESAGPVGDHCVKLAVKSADSDQVIDGFVGNWPAELGQQPALWIPASSVSTARLQATAGQKVITDSRSLVSSPVVLAIKPQLKPALAAQNWGTLPAIQANPVSLDALNMPGWGSLRLAMPAGDDNDAAYLAAEAVAAASAPPTQAATVGLSAVTGLVNAQPRLADSKLSTAMDALLAGGDPAVAPVHAVVLTEQQLYQRSTTISNAKDVVSSWLPPGPTALADYPMATLSGPWVSNEQAAAVGQFKEFLQKPEQLEELAKEGFRAGDAPLPSSDVISFSSLSGPVSIGDPSARVTVADVLSTRAGPSVVTIMLDQSLSTQEGANTRLANIVAALKNKLTAMPAGAEVGLWTFDGVDGRSEVTTGPLSDQVDGKARSAVLSTSLDDQVSSNGGAKSFTTLKALYDVALANYRAGMTNSVLVITAGPHTDQTLDGQGLQDYVRRTFDPARPVAINVIDFGSDPDRTTWESVARASGGAYQNLATSDSPELSTALTTFLG